MTTVYRFMVQGVGVLAPGKMVRVDDGLIVVASLSYDDASKLRTAAQGQHIECWVEVDGVDVAYMPVDKINAKDMRGHVEIWAIVALPDAFGRVM